MVKTPALTESAIDALRLHLDGRPLRLKGPNAETLPGFSSEETLAAHRESEVAGLLYPVSGFAYGSESNFRVTDA